MFPVRAVRDYSSQTPTATRGRTIWFLLAALLAGAVLWASLAGDGQRERPLQSSETVQPPRPAGFGDEQLAPGAPRPQEPAPDATVDRFEGRGRLRGELTVAPGIAPPREWTLVLEPHPWMSGRQRARAMRVEHKAGEREFDVPDLPLAAWQVRAEVPGLNSTRADVLLVRASPDSHVVLRLEPAGLVDGEVIDADHAPAEDLLVVLERAADKSRRETRTNPAGYWRFDDVVDGEYTVWFGRPEQPLLQPFPLQFVAPTLRFPKKQLPVCGALDIVVTDTRLAPQPDVEVTGFGDPQGTLQGVTGLDGTLKESWLWPGQYRLQARAKDGRVVDATVLVDPRQRATQVVRLP